MIERWKSIYTKDIKLGAFHLQGFFSFLHLAQASPSAQVQNIRGCLECPHWSGHRSSLHLSASPSDTPRIPPPPSRAHLSFSKVTPDIWCVCCSYLLPVFRPFPLFLSAPAPPLSLSLSLPHGRGAHPPNQPPYVPRLTRVPAHTAPCRGAHPRS